MPSPFEMVSFDCVCGIRVESVSVDGRPAPNPTTDPCVDPSHFELRTRRREDNARIAERVRIEALIQEHANDVQGLWEAKRDSASAAERWQSEYWRGQMNGLHHLLTALDEMDSDDE